MTLVSSVASVVLPQPRSDHTAAIVRGGSVLFAQGHDGTSSTEASTFFTPSPAVVTGPDSRWRRSGHTATTLMDGSVVVLGGVDSSNEPATNEVLSGQPSASSGALYDPELARFAWYPQALVVRRNDHTATMLPDGKILIVGGTNGTDELALAEIVDPVAATSELLPSGLQFARRGHTATLQADGSVLVIGGEEHGIPLASARISNLHPRSSSAC